MSDPTPTVLITCPAVLATRAGQVYDFVRRHHGLKISAGKVAAVVGVTPPNARLLLGQLVRAGLIRRVSSEPGHTGGSVYEVVGSAIDRNDEDFTLVP